MSSAQLVITFLLAALHEGGWVLYINGVAKKRLGEAVGGNIWILTSGTLTTYMVVHDLTNIVAVVLGGAVGVALMWPLIRNR